MTLNFFDFLVNILEPFLSIILDLSESFQFVIFYFFINIFPNIIYYMDVFKNLFEIL